MSASDPEHRVPGMNNLLIHEAAILGAREGLTRLHLGGGNTRFEDNRLLRFKRTMATERHRYKIAFRVHDRTAYGQLCTLWKEEFPQLAERYEHQILCYHNQYVWDVPPLVSGARPDQESPFDDARRRT